MTNNRILFIALVNMSDFSHGISKKVYWQTEAFFKHGFQIFNTSIENGKLLLLEGNNTVAETKCLSKSYTVSILSMFWFLPIYIYKKKINLIYVRYNTFLSILIFVLKVIFPRMKIYLELPTYPILKEYAPPNQYQKNNKKPIKSILSLSGYLLDRYLINKSIYKIVTYSKHTNIIGKKTIRINNGYGDFTKIIDYHPRTPTINFTMVATFGYWHGVDRILKSLCLYRKPGIVLNIVGDGLCLEELKCIVLKDNYLSNVVKFWGRQSGEKLFEIYKKSNIAIASLACHRKQITTTSELKIREYLSMGLPIVCSSRDLSIPNYFPAMFKVSSNDEPFSIEEILKWYSKLNMTPTQIRDFAQNNLSWYKQIQPIINDIKNENTL